LIYKQKIVLLQETVFLVLMSILATSPCLKSTAEELGIKSSPVWTCDVSSFDWTYEDKVTCLFLEGEVAVTLEKGQPVKIRSYDLVFSQQE